MHMTGFRHFLIVTLLLLNTGVLKSQSYIMLKGSVFSVTGDALVGAHARNLHRNYGTFTDFRGEFSLVLARNDTLKVTMIGYKTFLFRIPANLPSLNYSIKITLFEDTLMIPAVEIRPYPLTYPEFRQEFITMRTPQEIAVKKLKLPSEPFRRKYENPEGGLLLPGPFSLIYDNFSKEAKQRRKMAEILKRNALRSDFLNIISAEIHSHRFGISTDDEIDELIFYCGISRELLDNTPHYMLIVMVENCIARRNEHKGASSE
jgi:hypothetical protein